MYFNFDRDFFFRERERERRIKERKKKDEYEQVTKERYEDDSRLRKNKYRIKVRRIIRPVFLDRSIRGIIERSLFVDRSFRVSKVPLKIYNHLRFSG